MPIALRSDLLAFAAAEAAPAFEPQVERQLSRGNVDGIPGARRIALSVNREFAERLATALQAPEDADARQLRMSEEAVLAVSEALRGQFAPSILKQAARDARPSDETKLADVHILRILLPIQLFRQMRAIAPRRGLSTHEFVAGALAARISAETSGAAQNIGGDGV